jgi:hypothetical protein
MLKENPAPELPVVDWAANPDAAKMNDRDSCICGRDKRLPPCGTHHETQDDCSKTATRPEPCPCLLARKRLISPHLYPGGTSEAKCWSPFLLSSIHPLLTPSSSHPSSPHTWYRKGNNKKGLHSLERSRSGRGGGRAVSWKEVTEDDVKAMHETWSYERLVALLADPERPEDTVYLCLSDDDGVPTEETAEDGHENSQKVNPSPPMKRRRRRSGFMRSGVCDTTCSRSDTTQALRSGCRGPRG